MKGNPTRSTMTFSLFSLQFTIMYIYSRCFVLFQQRANCVLLRIFRD